MQDKYSTDKIKETRLLMFLKQLKSAVFLSSYTDFHLTVFGYVTKDSKRTN